MYRGVVYANGRWLAQVRYRGQNRVLGSFDSSIEAASAYDEMASRLLGGLSYDFDDGGAATSNDPASPSEGYGGGGGGSEDAANGTANVYGNGHGNGAGSPPLPGAGGEGVRSSGGGSNAKQQQQQQQQPVLVTNFDPFDGPVSRFGYGLVQAQGYAMPVDGAATGTHAGIDLKRLIAPSAKQRQWRRGGAAWLAPAEQQFQQRQQQQQLLRRGGGYRRRRRRRRR